MRAGPPAKGQGEGRETGSGIDAASAAKEQHVQGSGKSTKQGSGAFGFGEEGIRAGPHSSLAQCPAVQKTTHKRASGEVWTCDHPAIPIMRLKIPWCQWWPAPIVWDHTPNTLPYMKMFDEGVCRFQLQRMSM